MTILYLGCPTTCVTGGRADWDSAWEQEKLEATLCEMLDAKRAARHEAAAPPSGARDVGRVFIGLCRFAWPYEFTRSNTGL